MIVIDKSSPLSYNSCESGLLLQKGDVKMEFTKMHGAGNDFCLFNGIKQTLPDYSTLAKAVCDRHFGVGGDGIMVCLPSGKADIRMVYYNSDGSMGEMCGNGLSCFSKFVYEGGLVKKTEFTVETGAGVKKVRLNLNGNGEVQSISVHMGRPEFDPELVPTTLPGTPVIAQTIDVLGRQVALTAMRMLVPHCVVMVDDLEAADINGLGRRIEIHPAFPKKVNVNFVQVISRNRFRIKTWERAAGRTLACGTGCCASVVAGRLLGLSEDTVTLDAEGGELVVHVDEDFEVTMTGGAEFICRGSFSDWVSRRAKSSM
jgi:diaminopimelate epimerase